MPMRVVVKSGFMGEEEKAVVATPEDLESLLVRIKALKRAVYWGFPGFLSGIVSLMICFCDSCLKTRLDKIVEYSTLAVLFGIFIVCMMVTMFTLLDHWKVFSKTGKICLCAFLLSLASVASACPSSGAYFTAANQPSAGTVTVVQTEQQTGLLPIVGDVVSGVTTAIFGSTRTTTTVATAAAGVPVPSLGDVIPLQTKTKVFIPGRYVTTRSTYGEILRVWQPSHYEPIIAQSSALVVPQPIVVDKPPLDPTAVVIQIAPQRLQNVWIPGCYIDQPLVNGTVIRVWCPGHYELRSAVF